MLFNVATKFEILSKIGNVYVFLRQLELMHVCQIVTRWNPDHEAEADYHPVRARSQRHSTETSR